jgi:hypothetical protein
MSRAIHPEFPHQTAPATAPRTEFSYLAARLEIARAELQTVREQREILRTLAVKMRAVADPEAREWIEEALRITE